MDSTMIKDPIFTKQPYKAIYIVWFALTFIPRIALTYLYYFIPFLRQNSNWTWKTAANLSILNAVFMFLTSIELYLPENLNSPKGNAENWVVMDPAPAADYRGRLSSSSGISPVKIGARWTPRAFDPNQDQDMRIVIYFHLGAYIMSAGEKYSRCTGDILGEMLSERGLVLIVQYRLASDNKSHFPAQIQDGLTAYKYVLSLGVPASQIVLCGGSAGANLSLTLLRYLHEQNDLEKFPIPRALILFSPWLDLTTGPTALNEHRNRRTDYMSGELIGWAYKRYLPSGTSPDDPYISPLRKPFITPASMFIMTGSAEIVHHDAVQYAKEMESVGNHVLLDIIPYAMHDIASCGAILGFGHQQKATMLKAIDFVWGSEARSER